MEVTSKATRIRLLGINTPQMRAFHMTWFAFFLCFFAWFGIAPLMTIVRDEMVLTQSQMGVALLRRRPRRLLRAARQELLDPSKAWWGGRRGRLADRRCHPVSVSLGVVPLVLARFVEVPVRIEVAAGS